MQRGGSRGRRDELKNVFNNTTKEKKRNKRRHSKKGWLKSKT